MKAFFAALLPAAAVIASLASSQPHSPPPTPLRSPSTPADFTRLLPDSLPYSSVAWLCSHNAMSNRAEGFWSPNQNLSLNSQLEAGIHAQMWDLWPNADGSIDLRHGNGSLFLPGRTPLSSALATLKAFLDANPHAVVSLLLENYASDSSLALALDASGLRPACLTPASLRGDAWPTLGEMRKSGKRLVIFSDKPSSLPELLPMWRYCADTPWNAPSPADIISGKANRVNRGSPANPLFIVNHFTSSTLPSPSRARALNRIDVLNSRLLQLKASYPNRAFQFWAVDFADTGDCYAFIRALNHID